MGNGETTKVAVWARLFELWAKVCKLVIEGKRDPQKIIDFLQAVIMEKQEKFRFVADYGVVTFGNGRRFRVEVYENARKGMITTSGEQLAFLVSRGASLLGQLGLDLLGRQGLRELLPEGFWYASFEEENHRRVPGFSASSGGDWLAYVGRFGDGWGDNFRLLCFVEVRE